MADEWMKRAGKERTKGVRVRGVLTCAGEFLPFLCSFLCRRVIAYLLSSSSKKKSTTTLHGGKSIFWERIPSLSFLKKEFQYRWGSLYRLKSKVLSFFFGIDFGCENMFSDCRNMWQHNVSRASICDAQPIITLGSHEIDRRNFDRWSTLIFDWNKSLKIPYVFKSICVFLRGAA